MRKVRPLEWILCGVAALVLAAIFFPTFAYHGIQAPASVCISNVKQSWLALIQYASDENDRFAPRDRWMDATYPYTKTETIWHCPAMPKGAYGYAFNGALSGAKAPKDEASTPLVYDSVDPIRNASDLVTSLPLPGRHGSKEDGGRNNVAYADGHAKGVPARAVVH